ncbi:UNVERIFIED_CONTAM: hypothetical protein HDU68_012936 [Siphonaria sp. JEL0065]|nr:hypothetical protein HDU68_012936 [Siphonaria sp. JEL0065]
MGETEILLHDLFKVIQDHDKSGFQEEFSDSFKRLKKDGMKIKVSESRVVSIVAPVYYSKPGSIHGSNTDIILAKEASFSGSMGDSAPSTPLLQKGFILFDLEYHETIQDDPTTQIIPLAPNEIEFIDANRTDLRKEIASITKMKDDMIVTAQQADLKIKQITEKRFDAEELSLLMKETNEDILAKYDSGILRFRLYGAMNLTKPISTYVSIQIDGESCFKTQVHEKSTNPSWNTTCDICLTSFKHSKLSIAIMEANDDQKPGIDDVAAASWNGQLLDILGKKRTWVKCEDRETPTSNCGLYLSLGYLPIRESLSLALLETGILHIDIQTASNLEAVNGTGTSDPYCLVFLNDKPIHKTKTHMKELNPVFNETTSIEVKERLKSNLTLVVKDFNSTTRHIILGTVEVSLGDLAVEKCIQFERPLGGGARQGLIRFQLRFEHPGISNSLEALHETARPERIETAIAVGSRQESLGLKRQESSQKLVQQTPRKILGNMDVLPPSPKEDARSILSNTGKPIFQEPCSADDVVPAEKISRFKHGTVRLTIVEAKGLKAVDANGFADPYVKVHQIVHGQELILLKTKCIKKNLNPVWNAQVEFIVPPSIISLELKDKNLFSGSKPLGELELDLDELFELGDKNKFDGWFDVGMGGIGSVHIQGTYIPKLE